MSFLVQLDADFKQSLLSKNKNRVALLRLLKAALKNEMIALKKQDLNDTEIIKVLRRAAKQREDSIEQFTKGKRLDLVEQEKYELAILDEYLPAQMSLVEIKKIVAKITATMGELTPSQFGQIMSAVMQQTAGQADGKLVSQAVKVAINNK